MMTTPRTHPLARLRLVAALVLALSCAGAAAAQTSTVRIVAVPLQGPSELGPWSVGLAAGLQRALNVLDGVFVPPIGDPVVLADRAADAGMDPAAVLLDRFDASAVLGGRVASAPEGLDVTLERYGADGTVDARTVTVPADPAAALPPVTAAAIELLALSPTADDAADAEAVAGAAPTVEALQAVALASSRLPGPDAAALGAANDVSPGSSWVLAERARALSLEGDHEGAVAAATAATDATPQDVEAWTVRGVVERRAGDAAAAQEAFRAALERNPAHAVARTGLAGLLEDADAVREYERAIDAYPRLLDAHLALAARTEGARGLQRLRQAAERLPDASRVHAAIVERALEANDPAGALAYLREAAQDPLARSPSLYALAAPLGESALPFLQEGREAFPDDAGLTLAEAEGRLESGDAAAAEELLRPLAETRSDDPRIANALALALVAQDRADEAREVLAGAADADATVRFNLAQALLEAGLPRAAAAELEGDVGEDQGDPDVWAVYGTALAGAGRVDEAREALGRALDLAPEHDLAARGLRRLDERERVAGPDVDPLPQAAQAPFDRGLTRLEQGRFADAASAFGEAVEAAPDRPLLSFYLGTALQRDGRVREALDAYGPALEAFGGSGTVLNNVGFAHLQSGRYDRALPTLRDAVEAAPDNPHAHLNLGLTYYALSRYDDALDAWARATELDPSLESAVADPRERARRLAGGAGE